MNIPPKYEDVVAECNALKEELVHMTALRDTWYEQYQELKSSRQQRLAVAEKRAGDLGALLLESNELLYVIQDGLGGNLWSAVDVMRGKVFTALKPAEEGEGS